MILVLCYQISLFIGTTNLYLVFLYYIFNNYLRNKRFTFSLQDIKVILKNFILKIKYLSQFLCHLFVLMNILIKRTHYNNPTWQGMKVFAQVVWLCNFIYFFSSPSSIYYGVEHKLNCGRLLLKKFSATIS